MKKSQKPTQHLGSEPIEEKISSRTSYDDVVLAQIEAADISIYPDRILDMDEAGTPETWAEVEERLDSVDSETIRRNIARVDAAEWLQASKKLASEAKSISEKATSKKELFRVDALVDAFDREVKQRKIGIQPCRLHCQNALRDAYTRLS